MECLDTKEINRNFSLEMLVVLLRWKHNSTLGLGLRSYNMVVTCFLEFVESNSNIKLNYDYTASTLHIKPW